MKTIKFFLKVIAVIASSLVSIIIMEVILDFHDKVNTYEDSIWGFLVFCFMTPMMAYVISSLSIHFINRIK